jgi:hypothetical protein
VPDKNVERNSVSHNMLVIFEVGVIFEIHESVVEV